MRGTRGGFSRGGFSSSYRGSNYRGNSGGGGPSSYNNNSGGSYGHQNTGGGSGDRGGRFGGGGFRGGRGAFHNNDSFKDSSDSGSRFPKSTTRYQSIDRPDYYNKRPHQYSSRDRSPDHKRSRNESSRRSDDYGGSNVSGGGGYHRGGAGGGGGVSYASNRYDSRRSETRNHSSSSAPMNRSSFRDNNNSSSTTFHPTPYRERNMGPPASYAPNSRLRGGRIARGGTSYRGARGQGVRGRPYRGIPMSQSGRMAEMAALLRRKKLGPSYRRSSPDAERKLKIDKLRSSIKKNTEMSETAGTADSDGMEDDDEIADLDIEDGVTFDDDDDDDDDVIEQSDEADTDGVVAVKAAEIAPKVAAVRKTVKKELSAPVSTKADGSSDENLPVKEEGSKAQDSVADVEKADDDDTDGKSSRKMPVSSDQSTPEKRRSNLPPRSYIKLRCVHCDIPMRTFNMYTKHLLTLSHKRRLRIVQSELQLKLKALRRTLRMKVRDDTAGLEDSELIFEWCTVCKTNVTGGLAEHNRSRAHLDIKRMLFPACTICDVRFTHMMDYELHRCSLKHLKCEHEEQKQNSVDRERDVDWKEFTTVDCIGDVDGDIDDKEDSNGELSKDESAINNGEHISVGSEFVKDIQVKYCDLCRFYLPRDEDGELAMKKHCANRSHLSYYLSYKKNERLRMAAVKIHQLEKKTRLAEKRKLEEVARKQGAVESAKDDDDDDKSAAGIGTGETVQADDEIDSKIWADVDKDLGELLQAVSSENAHDDEDEEDSTTTTERYDRFKNSESGGSDESIGGEGGNTKATTVEGVIVGKDDKASDVAVATTAK